MSHPQKILDSLGARAQKRFSQNFLTSPHWAEKLTDALGLQQWDIDEIWELGPGLGGLTAPLLRKATVPVRLFEIDRKLIAYLKETYPEANLVETDLSRMDWSEAFRRVKQVAILSNLPYHLSSEILLKLTGFRRQVAVLVLTFQREYAHRLLAGPGDPDYGSLSVWVQTHFSIESLGVLPPGAFHPQPSIQSQALRLIPRDIEIPPGFERLLRASFSQRRKKLGNNLKPFGSDNIRAALLTVGRTPDCRAEELSPEEFLRFSRHMH